MLIIDLLWLNQRNFFSVTRFWGAPQTGYLRVWGGGGGLSLKRNLQAKLAFFHADLNLFKYWHLWWALCRCFGISLTGVHQKNKYIQ